MYPEYENKIYRRNFYKYTRTNGEEGNENFYFDFVLVINQLDKQNFCFTVSLFHACTVFEHMCSSSGGQNC